MRETSRWLTRYGCDSFSTQSDYATGRVVVGFVVPDTQVKGAIKIPVKLEINIRTVYDALFGQPTTRKWVEGAGYEYVHNPSGYDQKSLAQAERVGWRHLVLWVDAALSAASAGVQKISEAFLAHTLIADDDGKVRRVVDLLNKRTGGDWLAMLPPGDRAE